MSPPPKAQPPSQPAGSILLSRHANTLISHQLTSPLKSPFTHLPNPIPVTMHELSPSSPIPFTGQFGLIDFATDIRLPRHVHISPVKTESTPQHFTTERIVVLNGVAMVQLNAEIYVIPPRTLVTIAPGVPHTWTAAPKGVDFQRALAGRSKVLSKLCSQQEEEAEEATISQTTTSTSSASTSTVTSKATEIEHPPISNGTFLMVYEYEGVTGFFPTRQTGTLSSVAEYVRCEEGGLEGIRFPELGVEEVFERGWFVWGEEVWRVGGKGIGGDLI